MYDGILVKKKYNPQSVVMLATKIATTGIDVNILIQGTRRGCNRTEQIKL